MRFLGCTILQWRMKTLQPLASCVRLRIAVSSLTSPQIAFSHSRILFPHRNAIVTCNHTANPQYSTGVTGRTYFWNSIAYFNLVTPNNPLSISTSLQTKETSPWPKQLRKIRKQPKGGNPPKLKEQNTSRVSPPPDKTTHLLFSS